MPFFPSFRLPLACGLVVASSMASANDRTAEERCLLSAVRSAAADATVESIRRRCAMPAAPAGPQRTTAAGPPQPTSSGSPQPPPSGGPSAAVVDPTAAAATRSTSPVARRIALEREVWASRFALLPHRPNYLDPMSHSLVAPEGVAPDSHLQRNEVKFQISFKLPLTPPLFDGRAALFFAYTGQSWWQAYNAERSSPFREYSHEPELFVSWKPEGRVLGWDWRLTSAGFVHQSNGRSGESSRSWNRLFADLRFDRPDGWWIGLRPWWRIPESRKPYAGAAEGDDNPGIERYVGDGELRTGYVGDVHELTLTLRRSFARSGKGALQIDWSRPTGFSPNLRWHIQYFDGYGESMLDYRRRVSRIGFGLMLNDWY